MRWILGRIWQDTVIMQGKKAEDGMGARRPFGEARKENKKIYNFSRKIATNVE